MRDPHFFREINAYKVPETFATPESDQLPDREIAYRVVGLRSNEKDILNSRRFLERIRKGGEGHP